MFAELADYVRGHENYKLIIAVATPPKEKNLEIDTIVDLLREEMINNLPSDIDELSTHAQVEEVSDIELDEIIVHGQEISVSGNGIVSIGNQFGSDGDQRRGDGYISNESFPFEFAVTLRFNKKGKLEVDEADIKVDTSSSYE